MEYEESDSVIEIIDVESDDQSFGDASSPGPVSIDSMDLPTEQDSDSVADSDDIELYTYSPAEVDELERSSTEQDINDPEEEIINAEDSFEAELTTGRIFAQLTEQEVSVIIDDDNDDVIFVQEIPPPPISEAEFNRRFNIHVMKWYRRKVIATHDHESYEKAKKSTRIT